MDSMAPTGINSIQVFHTETLPEPDNHWLPNSYDEAMMQPDLWGEPIKKEMKNMRDSNVWKVIENPLDIRKQVRRGREVDREEGLTRSKGVHPDTWGGLLRVLYISSPLRVIAATNNMEAWQIDYVTTYLNSLPKRRSISSSTTGRLPSFSAPCTD